MESQPQNPAFRNNPENLHPCEDTTTLKDKSIMKCSHDMAHIYIDLQIRVCNPKLIFSLLNQNIML